MRDAQTWAGDEPWYTHWTWDEREEQSSDRWFKAWAIKTLHVSAGSFEKARWIMVLSYYLHRRDTCTYPEDEHDDAAERDLPRSRWLPVKKAMVTLPKDQWPK